MSLGVFYWFGMLLWLIVGFGWTWDRSNSPLLGGNLLLFLLLVAIGWQVFGVPIHH